MSTPAFLTSGASSLVGQFLDSVLPRAVVAAAHYYENESFAAAAAGRREQVLAWATDPSATDSEPILDVADYRYTVARLDLAGGAFISGIPLTGQRDKRMHALPELLRFTRGLAPNAVNLHRFMERLVDADPALFAGAILFSSRNAGPFLALHDFGGKETRSWLHWPLERLFVKRRASVLASPETGDQALAIPFSVPPNERYVVVAPFRTPRLSSADRDFVAAIQCIGVALPLVQMEPTRTHADKIDGAATSTLRLLYFGRDEIRMRMSSIARARGWTLAAADAQILQENGTDRRFDVLLFDAHAIAHPLLVLRALRRSAPGIAILYLGEAEDEGEALADAQAAADASDVDIVRAIKHMLREMPARRLAQMSLTVERASAAVFAAPSLDALCAALAKTAVEVAADWACVHIVDDDGTLRSAEEPSTYPPILPQLPPSFLNACSIVKSQVDAAFLDGLSGDDAEQQRLKDLAPVSGALIPVDRDGTIVGTIVALSQHLPFGDPHVEALSKVAALASDAFGSLKARRPASAPHGSWKRVSCAAFNVDGFSPHTPDPFALSLLLESFRIHIELRGPLGQFFSGALNARRGVLEFRSEMMPAPLLLRAEGPIAFLRLAGEKERLVLPEGSVALVYPAALTGAIERLHVVRRMQEALHTAGPEDVVDAAGALCAEGQGFILITCR